MNLEETLERALTLTRDLTLLVQGDDLTRIQVVLASRAEAMAAFEAEHRFADPAAQELSADLLQELAVADRELQATLAGVIEETSRMLHSTAAVPASSRTYDSPPLQACVDRKA